MPGFDLPGTNKNTGETPQPFTLEEFGSLDTKAKRPAISPKDFFWIENFMPIGPANMRTLYGEESTPIYTASNPRTIVYYTFYNIGSTRYCAVFLDNGTAVQVNTTTLALTTISATVGKFWAAGQSLPAAVQYQAKYLIITSKVSGDAYWAWDGTSLFGLGTLEPQVTMTNSGSGGYTSAPTVTAFGGSGSGATFTANLDAQKHVTDVTVTNPGSGYGPTDLVTLVFTGGGGTDQARATATVSLSSAGVSIVLLTNGGHGYTSPVVAFSGGGGSGAKAFVSGAANGSLTDITITDPGSGYTSSPTVAITDGGGGTGATAVCEIRAGQITAITVNSGGAGYVGQPDVLISAPNNTQFPNIQAEATATVVAGAVTAVTVTVMGIGYMSATVDLSGGNGSAEATIEIMPAGISGTSLEVYQERIWVGDDTKLSYTAASSIRDFSGSAGGGSKPLTDSILREKCVALHQANGFLYYFGDSSIFVISNVQTSTNAVTTFNTSNVDPQIGSAWRDSISAFGRALVFANPTGIYALYGGAAEKVSGPLDGLFQKANFTSGVTPTSAVATIFSIRVYSMLMTTTDPFTGTERNIMVMWDGQRWFVGTQTFSPKILAGQEIGSILTGYGADSTTIHRLFQTPSTALLKRFATKLVAPSSYIVTARAMRVYYLAQTETGNGGQISVALENQIGANPAVSKDISSSASWVNNAGAISTWVGAGGAAHWSSKGLSIVQYDDSMYGQLLGATVSTVVDDLTFISMTLLLQDYAPNA